MDQQPQPETSPAVSESPRPAPQATLPQLLKPDVRMWLRALRVIPRITPTEWASLDLISRWLIASRGAVLVITAIPCLIAGILAFRDDRYDLLLWLTVTAGLLLAHATNNLLNDLTDYLKGVDRGNYFRAQYGPQPLEHGLMTVRQSVVYIVITGALAMAAGIYLVAERGGITLGLLAAGAFFVLFYTWPLKYIGLGELAVVAVWGPLMIGGAYYVVTGAWDWNVAVLSLIYALGATSVIFGKHVDKYEDDRNRGIRTLPVLIGERNARWAIIGMLILPYLLTFYFIGIGYFTPVLLVVVLAGKRLKGALEVLRKPRPSQPPPAYPQEAWPLWFVSFAFVHNRSFGSWFVLGLVADVLLRKIALW